MNTFFAQRGYRLTLDESARLSAQVHRSYLCPSFKVALVVCSHAYFYTLPPLFCRSGLGYKSVFMIASGFGLAALHPCPSS
jgi:hypothetical protein